VRVGELGRLLYLGLGSAGQPHLNVLGDGADEERRLLRHEPELLAQPLEVERPQVGAVEGHRARRGVVEALEQRDDGRLARARRAAHGAGATRRDAQVVALAHVDVRRGGIGEGHVGEHNLAADRGGRCARLREGVDGRGASDGLQHLVARGGRLEEVLHGARELCAREDALEECLDRDVHNRDRDGAARPRLARVLELVTECGGTRAAFLGEEAVALSEGAQEVVISRDLPPAGACHLEGRESTSRIAADRPRAIGADTVGVHLPDGILAARVRAVRLGVEGVVKGAVGVLPVEQEGRVERGHPEDVVHASVHGGHSDADPARRGRHCLLGREQLCLVPRQCVGLEPERGHGAQSRQDLRGHAPRPCVRVGQGLGLLVEGAEEVVHGWDVREGGDAQCDQGEVPPVPEADGDGEDELAQPNAEEPRRGHAQAALDVHQGLAHARRELLRLIDIVPTYVLPQDALDVALLPLGDLSVLGQLDARGTDALEERAHRAEDGHHAHEEDSGVLELVWGDVEEVAEDNDDEALRRAEG